MSDIEEDDNTALALDSMFTEAPRPPSPEPTIAVYEREHGEVGQASRSHAPDDIGLEPWAKIELNLVGSHPLWGHHLWNAARAFAWYLDEHLEVYRQRAVLELGAGGGLPGIVCAKNGARTVALTDYPDAALLETLQTNVQKNVSPATAERIHVRGYIWGQPVDPLLSLTSRNGEEGGFDLIIMSDLIFNHSQHEALLRTCEQALSKTCPADQPQPSLLVFYTHHRPHLAHRDMEFFTKAKERGWVCEEIVTRRYPPMFPDDPGEEEVRATVHGWRLTRNS